MLLPKRKSKIPIIDFYLLYIFYYFFRMFFYILQILSA
nr:MAG TPA: hypothetical protein [Caudoviricetes sp.]